MNEAETRAEYIDPRLRAKGWGKVEGSKVLREFRITDGRIQAGGNRAKPEIADYILIYKNRKIGVIEAKADDLEIRSKRKNQRIETQSDFAILTAEISKACFGMTPSEYKKLKN